MRGRLSYQTMYVLILKRLENASLTVMKSHHHRLGTKSGSLRSRLPPSLDIDIYLSRTVGIDAMGTYRFRNAIHLFANSTWIQSKTKNVSNLSTHVIA